jgi:DNA-binding response OmpR family regulator
VKGRILVIEDDKDLQFALKEYLTGEYYFVDQAFTGAEGLRKASLHLPDLVILDLGLPDMDGESICQNLKKDYPQLPIIILTAKNTPQDAARGLGLGADDYLAKPFDLDEFLARIKARLKKGQKESELKIADLYLNRETFEVKRAGKKISLTRNEYNLLEYLLQNQGRVIPREMILSQVWGYQYDVQSRVVDVYIGYLRRKIDAPFDKKLINTVRGFGYMIKG